MCVRSTTAGFIPSKPVRVKKMWWPSHKLSDINVKNLPWIQRYSCTQFCCYYLIWDTAFWIRKPDIGQRIRCCITWTFKCRNTPWRGPIGQRMSRGSPFLCVCVWGGCSGERVEHAPICLWNQRSTAISVQFSSFAVNRALVSHNTQLQKNLFNTTVAREMPFWLSNVRNWKLVPPRSRWWSLVKIWANAHETRHSISIISYAGCLVDLQQFRRKFTRSVYAVA